MTVLDYRSKRDDAASEIEVIAPRGHWLGWAVFLAMSWTWCIGMFLPVLMVRDFGIWGWVVFIIPNVVGAAAMGWVLRTTPSSDEITDKHGAACIVFALVTILFQAYFAGWIGGESGVVCALSVSVILAILMHRSHWDLAIAVVVLAISLLAIANYVSQGQAFTGLSRSIVEREPPGSLLLLTPVVVFGFLLCPYLDLTFHRARQSMKSLDARKGFSLGFGAIFLLMMVFTLAYAGHFLKQLPNVNLLSGEILGVYMGVQLGLTIALHIRDLHVLKRVGGFPILIVVLLAIGVARGLLDNKGLSPGNGISAGELGYRIFLSFYGLIFPAYVWLCMIPGRGRIAPNLRQLIVLTIAVSVASPMYWMGFIERRMFWLLPGVGVVLLSRLFVQQNSAPTSN